MIVNYTSKGWEIITQRAHGLLAAQLGFHWKAEDRPARWVELLIAIADHDDAEIELERSDLLTDQGGPINFNMRKFDHQYCTRMYEFALSKSRFVTLLTAVHIRFVFGAEKETNAEAKAFMKMIDEAIYRLTNELKLGKEETESSYAMLEWCDALSLLICQHENQPESRAIEISSGPSKESHHLIQRGDGELTITPWPFDKDEFEVRVERRILPQLSFKDAGEFKHLFQCASVEEIVWMFKR